MRVVVGGRDAAQNVILAVVVVVHHGKRSVDDGEAVWTTAVSRASNQPAGAAHATHPRGAPSSQPTRAPELCFFCVTSLLSLL